MEKSRKLGYDAVRITAIFMIVMIHVSAHVVTYFPRRIMPRLWLEISLTGWDAQERLFS